MYTWQLKDWFNCQFDESLFNDFEKEFLISAGRIEGVFSHISKETSQQSLVDLLVNEAQVIRH
jgi:hypothetical protein